MEGCHDSVTCDVVMPDDVSPVGVDGALASGAAAVVTEHGVDIGEAFPAASTAATVNT